MPIDFDDSAMVQRGVQPLLRPDDFFGEGGRLLTKGLSDIGAAANDGAQAAAAMRQERDLGNANSILASVKGDHAEKVNDISNRARLGEITPEQARSEYRAWTIEVKSSDRMKAMSGMDVKAKSALNKSLGDLFEIGESNAFISATNGSNAFTSDQVFSTAMSEVANGDYLAAASLMTSPHLSAERGLRIQSSIDAGVAASASSAISKGLPVNEQEFLLTSRRQQEAIVNAQAMAVAERSNRSAKSAMDMSVKSAVDGAITGMSEGVVSPAEAGMSLSKLMDQVQATAGSLKFPTLSDSDAKAARSEYSSARSAEIAEEYLGSVLQNMQAGQSLWAAPQVVAEIGESVPRAAVNKFLVRAQTLESGAIDEASRDIINTIVEPALRDASADPGFNPSSFVESMLGQEVELPDGRKVQVNAVIEKNSALETHIWNRAMQFHASQRKKSDLPERMRAASAKRLSAFAAGQVVDYSIKIDGDSREIALGMEDEFVAQGMTPLDAIGASVQGHGVLSERSMALFDLSNLGPLAASEGSHGEVASRVRLVGQLARQGGAKRLEDNGIDKDLIAVAAQGASMQDETIAALVTGMTDPSADVDAAKRSMDLSEVGTLAALDVFNKDQSAAWEAFQQTAGWDSALENALQRAVAEHGDRAITGHVVTELWQMMEGGEIGFTSLNGSGGATSVRMSPTVEGSYGRVDGGPAASMLEIGQELGDYLQSNPVEIGRNPDLDRAFANYIKSDKSDSAKRELASFVIADYASGSREASANMLRLPSESLPEGSYFRGLSDGGQNLIVRRMFPEGLSGFRLSFAPFEGAPEIRFKESWTPDVTAMSGFGGSSIGSADVSAESLAARRSSKTDYGIASGISERTSENVSSWVSSSGLPRSAANDFPQKIMGSFLFPVSDGGEQRQTSSQMLVSGGIPPESEEAATVDYAAALMIDTLMGVHTMGHFPGGKEPDVVINAGTGVYMFDIDERTAFHGRAAMERQEAAPEVIQSVIQFAKTGKRKEEVTGIANEIPMSEQDRFWFDKALELMDVGPGTKEYDVIWDIRPEETRELIDPDLLIQGS